MILDGPPVDAEVMLARRYGVCEVRVAVVGAYPFTVHANASGKLTSDT